MSMTKRNVLFILGLVVAIGGVAIASGAFSQVEADRNVSINVTGDDAAFVSMSPANSDFVTTNGNGQIEINTNGLGGSGVHQNATIVTKDAITFAHNGNTSTTYNVTLKTSGVSNGDIRMYNSTTEIDDTTGLMLSDGDSENVYFEIDTNNGTTDMDGTFTIHIEETST